MRIQFVVLAAAVFALVVVVALLALPSRGPAPTYTLRAALPSFGVEVLDPSADFQAGHRYYGHLFDY
ncbi:MAG: hypothetical protein HY678_10520, partial [Chloroflexi bacterium]|nr:hypothetical protein [Chloroflexota bacterium]